MHPPLRRGSLRPFALAAVLLALGSCASEDPFAKDVIRDRLLQVDVDADGFARLRFERSQRIATIDPVRSPDAAAMLAFAKRAAGNEREVEAAVDGGGDRHKGDDGPAFLVVGLRWTEAGR